MPIYECKICNIQTSIKSHYIRHQNTNKHKNNLKLTETNNTNNGKMTPILTPIDSTLTPAIQFLTPADSNLTPDTPKLTPAIQNLTPADSNLTSKTITTKTFTCDYCSQTFTRKNNLNRHLKSRCKDKEIIKNKEIDSNSENSKSNYDLLYQEYKEYKNETKQQMDKLYEQIDHLIDRVGVNITQNVMLNSYGQEDMSHITDTFKTSLLKIPYGMIPKMIEKVHFSDEKPENNNICLPNKKEPYVKVFDTGKWVFLDKKKAIMDLVDKNYDILDQFYETDGQEVLNDSQQTRYQRFQERKDNGDTKLEESIVKDTNLLLLNSSKT